MSAVVDPGAIPTAYLVEEHLGRLDLIEANGYFFRSLDLGHPTPRARVTPRINASGAEDATALHGPRAVSLVVDCFATRDGAISRRTAIERLRAYTHPARRPALVFAEDDGAPRRVVLRGENVTWPLSTFGQDVPVQLAFTAPTGLIEAATETTVLVPAGATAVSAGGTRHPYQLPLRFSGSGSVAGAVPVANGEAWGADTDYVARLWGPCTGPRLSNLTTGATFALPGLALTAEQFAEVDTAAATIRLNGRAGETLYTHQEWGVSTFWQLRGGVNQVRYHPDVVGAADTVARAELAFRPATI